jgi:hypothetical protein
LGHPAIKSVDTYDVPTVTNTVARGTDGTDIYLAVTHTAPSKVDDLGKPEEIFTRDQANPIAVTRRHG